MTAIVGFHVAIMAIEIYGQSVIFTMYSNIYMDIEGQNNFSTFKQR